MSWTLFAVPFVVAARPSGWLADHMDRRSWCSAASGHRHGVLCVLPVHLRRAPADGAGGHRGPRVRRRPALPPVTAHPGFRALRGRTHPGHVRHHPDRLHGGVGGAGRRGVRPTPGGCPSCHRRCSPPWPSAATAIVWHKVPGHVAPGGRAVAVERHDAPAVDAGTPGAPVAAQADGRGQHRGAVGALGRLVRHLGQALGALAHGLLARARPSRFISEFTGLMTRKKITAAVMTKLRAGRSKTLP